jgi:hypothetical protein
VSVRQYVQLTSCLTTAGRPCQLASWMSYYSAMKEQSPERNRIHLVLFGIQNRTMRSYLIAVNRILTQLTPLPVCRPQTAARGCLQFLPLGLRFRLQAPASLVRRNQIAMGTPLWKCIRHVMGWRVSRFGPQSNTYGTVKTTFHAPRPAAVERA